MNQVHEVLYEVAREEELNRDILRIVKEMGPEREDRKRKLEAIAKELSDLSTELEQLEHRRDRLWESMADWQKPELERFIAAIQGKVGRLRYEEEILQRESTDMDYDYELRPKQTAAEKVRHKLERYLPARPGPAGNRGC